MSVKPTKVPTLIVGGGIGGLTTALALARMGRPVLVWEKAAEFAELGAGLQLAPNALHVLDQLGLLSEVAKHAVFPSRLVWMDAIREQPITTVDLGAEFQARYKQRYVVMHRSDLLSLLLAACQAEPGVTLEPSRDVASIEDLGETARATCTDGTVCEAELLVGADGLASVARRLIVDDAPINDGYVAYRGTLPMAQMSTHAGLDNVVMWVGPQMHFVQYPIRRAELYNQVAVFRSPRYSPGATEWGTVEELDAHYTQTCAYVQACVRLMWRDRRWPMHDRKPIGTWTRNRIVLMGDAAHAMYQYIAQGACQAIEDALSLAKQVTATPGDLPAALKAYEMARKYRTARVQLTARAMGAFFHLDGFAAETRNQTMAARSPTDYSMLDWLYGHRV